MIDHRLRQRLEAVHSLFQKIEKESSDGHFNSVALNDLALRLEELRSDERPEVSKLADLSRHFQPLMTLRTFVHLMLPVERALGKIVQDDDFLVSSKDTSVATGRTYPVRLALENLRSAFNVGSLLRSADGLGVEHVHLLGYTPGPDEEKTSKTAMGAQDVISWDRVADIAELRSKFPDYRIIALETAASAVHLTAPFEQEHTIFLVGNERFGLSAETLAQVDEVRVLPMEGRKNSMNVAVIAALAIYEWKRQWKG